MERKIGISTCAMQWKHGDKGALEMAARTGAVALDFDTCIAEVGNLKNPNSVYSKGDNAVIEYYTELKEHADKLGIEIYQTHGRGDGYTPNEKDNERRAEEIRLDLLAAKTLGAKVCVIHTPNNLDCGPWRNPNRELMDRLFDEQLQSALPYAKEYGVKLAIETNGFVACAPIPVCEYFGYLKNFEAAYRRNAATACGDWLAVCIDSGHSNLAMPFGNPEPADIVRTLGPNAVHALHLHDNLRGFDEHCLPLTGFVDFPDLFRALDEVGYTGVYNLEVNFNIFGQDFQEETATFTVQLLRRMLDRHDGRI